MKHQRLGDVDPSPCLGLWCIDPRIQETVDSVIEVFGVGKFFDRYIRPGGAGFADESRVNDILLAMSIHSKPNGPAWPILLFAHSDCAGGGTIEGIAALAEQIMRHKTVWKSQEMEPPVIVKIWMTDPKMTAPGKWTWKVTTPSIPEALLARVLIDQHYGRKTTRNTLLEFARLLGIDHNIAAQMITALQMKQVLTPDLDYGELRIVNGCL